MDTPNLQKKPLTEQEIRDRLQKLIIVEIKLLDKNNTLAAANIILPLGSSIGTLSISGFLIFNSSKENPILGANINITPPSRQVFNKYYPQVYFSKKEFWNLLQKMIFEKYLLTKEEQLKKVLI